MSVGREFTIGWVLNFCWVVSVWTELFQRLRNIENSSALSTKWCYSWCQFLVSSACLLTTYSVYALHLSTEHWMPLFEYQKGHQDTVFQTRNKKYCSSVYFYLTNCQQFYIILCRHKMQIKSAFIVFCHTWSYLCVSVTLPLIIVFYIVQSSQLTASVRIYHA